MNVCMIGRKTKLVLLSSCICYCYVSKDQRSERKQKSKQEEEIKTKKKKQREFHCLQIIHSAGAYNNKKCPGAVA